MSKNSISKGRKRDLQYHMTLIGYLVAGPTVLSVYVFALWCLITQIGLTNSFPWSAGPLSNWMIWLFLALTSNFVASNFKRTNPVPSLEKGRLNSGLDVMTGTERAPLSFSHRPKAFSVFSPSKALLNACSRHLPACMASACERLARLNQSYQTSDTAR